MRNRLTAGARLLSRSKLRTSLRPRSPRVLNEPTEPLSPNFTPLLGGWVNFESHRLRSAVASVNAKRALLPAAVRTLLRLKSRGPPAFSHPLLILSLIHISEPTRLLSISYAVFC